jgi:hypothetical protein
MNCFEISSKFLFSSLKPKWNIFILEKKKKKKKWYVFAQMAKSETQSLLQQATFFSPSHACTKDHACAFSWICGYLFKHMQNIIQFCGSGTNLNQS